MFWILLSDSLPPNFDPHYWVTILSRVFHTVSAATLLGGMVYLRYLVAPSTGVEDDLYRGRRATWSRLVMLTTTLLMFSGFYNLYLILVVNEKLPSMYHMLFGIKFLLALWVFFIAAATAGTSSLATRIRANLRWWLGVCLASMLAVFLLGAILRSFEKIPRPILEPPAVEARDNQSVPVAPPASP